MNEKNKLFSAAFGLVSLFNAKNMPPLIALIPVSFTLTGMITTIAFFNSTIFKIKEKKE